MIGLSALLVFLLGVLELVVIIKVGAAIGAIEAVALLIGVTIVGVWLVKREGLAVLRRARRDADEGRMPTASLLDGMILLVAGALLIFPGFLTDIVAVFLLLPPVRVLVRRALVARYGRRMSAVMVRGDTFPPTGPPMGFGASNGRADGRVVDAESHLRTESGDEPPHRHDPPALPGPS